MMRRQSVDATAGHKVDLEGLRQLAAKRAAEREAMAEKRRKRREKARRRRQSVVDAGGDLRKGGKGKKKKGKKPKKPGHRRRKKHGTGDGHGGRQRMKSHRKPSGGQSRRKGGLRHKDSIARMGRMIRRASVSTDDVSERVAEQWQRKRKGQVAASARRTTTLLPTHHE